MHKMVYKFLQQHNLLSVYQSGFRRLHSNSTCLTDVTNTLLQNIDKGQLTGLVLLDLAKTFDTLDHSVLLDKLASLGFSKASIQWFKAYLTDRTQSVVVNGSTSDPQSIVWSPARVLDRPLVIYNLHQRCTFGVKAL